MHHKAGLTKHQGQSTHNYRYDAYGQVLPAQGNWTDPHNHYTFLGKEWDEHLGLYEFGFRLYDPWAGVWLTREPLPGRAWVPRTWHRYQYAFASPISYYDPYGLAVIADNGSGSRMLSPTAQRPIPSPPAPASWPIGAQKIEQCAPQPWAIQIIIDTQQIAQRILFSSQAWAQVATILDTLAWLSDVMASGLVITGTVLGFIGGAVVEEKPVPGGTLAGALAGLWMTELSVRPLLLAGNTLASFATGATIISEAKEDKTRLRMALSLNSTGISYEYHLAIGTSTQIAIATTTLGWIAPEAFTSLLYQSVALASDVGWISTPWGSIQAQGQGFIPLAIPMDLRVFYGTIWR